VSAQQTASPSCEDQAAAPTPAELGTAPSAAGTPSPRTAGLGSAIWAIVRVGAGTILTASLLVALVAGGLFVAPTISAAAYDVDAPPLRPPIVPPSVPLGAREDWAVWSYVDKISQVWGRDWPLVIQWFEELDERYPENPMVLDKLYVAYIEDGRALMQMGDLDGARHRFEQAARYDPDRGVAQELLAELDTAAR
jgi:hypothetical protein